MSGISKMPETQRISRRNRQNPETQQIGRTNRRGWPNSAADLGGGGGLDKNRDNPAGQPRESWNPGSKRLKMAVLHH